MQQVMNDKEADQAEWYDVISGMTETKYVEKDEQKCNGHERE